LFSKNKAQVRRERLREAERKRQALQKQEAELQQREGVLCPLCTTQNNRN